MVFHRFCPSLAACALLTASGTLHLATSAARAETGTTTTIHQFSPPTLQSGLIQATDGNFYGTSGGGGIHGFGTVFRITSAGAIITLHSFNGTDGYYPQASLVQGTDGALYGTTLQGGPQNDGTLFKVTTGGVFTSLHSFDDFNKSDGAGPHSALVQGNDGNFYGTTANGGMAADGFTDNEGTVFRITPAGVFTSLHAFGNQEANDIYGGLAKGNDGNFYGVGEFGGVNGAGAFFRITPAGVMTTLHSFTSAESAGPTSSLSLGADGNFYGVSEEGGTAGYGTVFRITPGGAYTLLHSFLPNNMDGNDPVASLIRGADGNFYGTTEGGGIHNSGTVFRATTGGTVTVIHNFDSNNGTYEPLGSVVQGTDGFLYGTTFQNSATSYHGEIFKVSTGGAYTTIYNFPGSDGQDPMSGLTQGTDGNFYGTTYYGGDHGNGAVYKMTSTGTPTTLHSFNDTDGNEPIAGVVQASDGNFYGVTHLGGTAGIGVFFRVTSSGVYTLLRSFDNDGGGFPETTLIQAKDGFLYGTTSFGTSTYNGAVYRISTAGALTNLHQFNTTDGINPGGALLQAADGNFYGVLDNGGANSIGSVYKVTPAGAFTTLHSFNGDDGRYPIGSLIQGTDGNFYGATTSGGPNSGFGTIYRITAAGAMTILHTFNSNDGYSPNGLTAGGDGYFYGTSSSGGSNEYGTLFRITSGGTFALLHEFDYAGGGTPLGQLVKATDGAFYGTASAGGDEYGTVFKFSLVPTLTSATTATATVGQAFTYQTTGSNNPTSFAATGLPPGLSINTTTGKITGTPTTAGTFAVKLSLTNANGTNTATLTITVKGSPPVITSNLNPPSRVTVSFAYQITATNNPTSFAATGLPPGLGLSASTGKISGTPKTAGTYHPVIKATNASGTGSATLTILVKAEPPVITSNLNPPSRQGVAFGYQITATNTPTSYSATGLPSGLGLSTSTGRISGTPTKAGTYNVAIKATNSGGTGTATLTIVVKPPA